MYGEISYDRAINEIFEAREKQHDEAQDNALPVSSQATIKTVKEMSEEEKAELKGMALLLR